MHSEPLNRLKELVAGLNVTIPPWLEDLVVNGPRYELWPQPNARPNRVILTEFLARWLKASGVSEERALEWLLEYCRQVLAQFSKTGPSGIRHGTRANTRWVYKSNFSFDFDAIASQVPAPEWAGKPAYMPVFARWDELLVVEKQKALELYRQTPRVQVPLSVKERYREKFEEGLKLAREKRALGVELEQITTLLNEAGYPTRTGRKWTLGTLYQTLRGR
jgi:hypothetical protein